MIDDYNDLKAFARMVNNADGIYYAKLSRDIVATDKSWTPIGKDANHAFNGTFDGKGHTITGLDTSESGLSSNSVVGLFGIVDSSEIGTARTRCTVRNVGVVDGRFTGAGDDAVGGVVAHNLGIVENCFFTGGVSSSGTKSKVGGIVGHQLGGIVSNCYSVCSVDGIGVGGIAGRTQKSKQNACLGNCFYGGWRVDRPNFGAIVGVAADTFVSHCYYDSQKASPDIGRKYNDVTVTGVAGLLTKYFTIPDYFKGFDFENVWYMGDSHPMLRVFLKAYPYADPTDAAHPVKSAACIPVTENTATLRTGWYAVTADVTASQRITVAGDVNLVLCDGCTLKASEGINLAVADNVTNSLTVWCQSGGGGKLEAVGFDSDAAIGGDGYRRDFSSQTTYAQPAGALTIYGGTVSATARGAGAGIGGGGVGDNG